MTTFYVVMDIFISLMFVAVMEQLDYQLIINTEKFILVQSATVEFIPKYMFKTVSMHVTRVCGYTNTYKSTRSTIICCTSKKTKNQVRDGTFISPWTLKPN